MRKAQRPRVIGGLLLFSLVVFGILALPSAAEAACEDCWLCCPPFNSCTADCTPHEPTAISSVWCTREYTAVSDCRAIERPGSDQCKGGEPCEGGGVGGGPDLWAGGKEIVASSDGSGWFSPIDGDETGQQKLPFD